MTTIDGLVDLKEYCITNGIKGERYHIAVETYLESLVEHKKIYGSAKHLLKMKDDSYEKAMVERKHFAYQKAIDTIR